MMRRLHRANAALLALFLVLHLANHGALLGGTGAHETVMDALRPLYRSGLVETPLLALFAAQIALGLALLLHRGWPRGGWGWAQAASGLYLAAFLMIHVGAVLTARSAGTETDVHFAAAGLHQLGLRLFFGPYYTLAVAALFTHIAAAMRFAGYRAAPRLLPFDGILFGIVIVLGLLGVFGGSVRLPGSLDAPPTSH